MNRRAILVQILYGELVKGLFLSINLSYALDIVKRTRYFRWFLLELEEWKSKVGVCLCGDGRGWRLATCDSLENLSIDDLDVEDDDSFLVPSARCMAGLGDDLLDRAASSDAELVWRTTTSTKATDEVQYSFILHIIVCKSSS